MGRTGRLPRVLWALALGACGRVGFGDETSASYVLFDPNIPIETECGAEPTPWPVNVQNGNTEEIEILGAEADGGFVVDPIAVPSLAPNEGMVLRVRPPAAVIGTDRGGDTKRGTLTLHTSVGDVTTELVAKVQGANIDLTTDTGLPLTLTFSGAGCPAPITAQVWNMGTLPGDVRVSPSQRFIVSGFTSGMVSVPGNAAVPFTVRPYTSSICAASEDLTFTVTGSVCSVTPIVLAGSFDISGSSTCACS